MERLNLEKFKIMAAAATLAMFAGTACAHVEVYGEVNKAFEQVWADKQDTGVIVDNNYSPSKFGITGTGNLSKCTVVGGVAELQLMPNNTRLVNQLQTDSSSTRLVLARQVDSWVSGGMWGKLSLGLGYAASYGITDISYAGTNQTSLGSSVANNAGGMFFGRKNLNATIDDPTVNEVFNALNGVGDIDSLNAVFSTKERVRYDTASWMGFKLSASYGNTANKYVLWSTQVTNPNYSRRTYTDVALRYDACWDDFHLGAGVAGAWFTRDHTAATTTLAAATRNERAWSASIAVEHKPTGFNAAVAGGQKRQGLATHDDYEFWYIQLGKKFCFTSYGKTNFAIDYFQSKNAIVNDSKGKTFGFGVTQELQKINSALYASLRNYKYDNVPNVNYQDLFVGSIGIQFKFGAML